MTTADEDDQCDEIRVDDVPEIHWQYPDAMEMI